jgi:hypothetical protein
VDSRVVRRAGGAGVGGGASDHRRAYILDVEPSQNAVILSEARDRFRAKAGELPRGRAILRSPFAALRLPQDDARGPVAELPLPQDDILQSEHDDDTPRAKMRLPRREHVVTFRIRIWETVL